ncbi:MAG TPA: hypothetical protein VMY78_11075 [Solirubrobacteraceae bacterium]|nr:hypothetical protein [Solirubrobacteraceae bacterium]
MDLPTLLATAAASAGAAYACSKLWPPGTLASAAFTPVLVAILKEAIMRPTEAVTRAVPVRGVVRSAPPPDGEPAPTQPALERVPRQGEVSGSSAAAGPRRWKLAIVTGLLGFVLAVCVLTVPELVAGQSASGGGRSTTLFGGDKERNQDGTQTQTTTVEKRTVTVQSRTVVVPPARTTTVPAITQTVTAPPATQPPTVTEPPVVQPPG